MTSEKLILKLKDQIKFLSNQKIRGLDTEDIEQELMLMVLEDVKKNPKFLAEEYSEGWWFKRLKWHIQNLREKEHRDPVNKSLRFESFNRKK